MRTWWHRFVALQIGHQNPSPAKHAVLCMLMQCRVPECNERDILMAFHLFMRRKWRGTVTFWNGWQNKEPTLGKWLYLWFHSDRWRYQERDGVTHFWQFKVLNDVMYGNILEHGGTSLIYFHFKNQSLTSADLGGSWEVIAVISANMGKYCILYSIHIEHKNIKIELQGDTY